MPRLRSVLLADTDGLPALRAEVMCSAPDIAHERVLASALRRVELRGHLGDVYQPLEPVGGG